MSNLTLHATIFIDDSNITFQLAKPVSVSRIINLSKNSNAFNLPEVTSNSFSYKDVFIGDVLRGGSCNVDILSFCPHNLTHLECSSHILDQIDENAVHISSIPIEHLQGLVYLIDLSSMLSSLDKLITKRHLEQELQKIKYPVTAIAIKTPSSNLDQAYDFSNKDFIALSQEAAELLTNFSINGQKISIIILDLPSTDPENDGGKLIAHRIFFEIIKEGFTFEDTKKKAIVELAHFGSLVQNYYYFIMTPAKIQSNSIVTDILFYPLKQT